MAGQGPVEDEVQVHRVLVGVKRMGGTWVLDVSKGPTGSPAAVPGHVAGHDGGRMVFGSSRR